MHPTPASLLSTSLLIAAAIATLSPACAQVRFGRHDGPHLESHGPFGPPHLNAMAPGDVDGDGDLDLLFVSNGGGEIRFNDGDTFHRSGALPTTAFYRARRGALVDVDGDGDLDAFLAGGGTAYGGGPWPSALLRNDGTGVFTQSLTIPTTPLDTTVLEFADIDGDTDQDALLVDWNGTVRIWRNGGSGAFADVTATSFSSTVPTGARFADRDGDGTLELFGAVSNSYVWFQNDGTGVFSPVGPTGSLLFTGAHFGLADCGGDGDSDLLTTNGVYENDGTGALTHVGSAPPFTFGNGLGDAVFADFDGDGDLDVAGTAGGQNPFLWRDSGGFVFIDATADWFEPHARAVYLIDYSYRCSCAADLDGDGDVDLATGGVEGRNNASTTVGVPPRLYLNSAGQGFVDASRPAFPRLQDVSEESDTVNMGDLDGDGDVDLVFDGNRLWRQDAAGQFGPAQVLPAVGGDASALADVDGDGDLDLLALRPPLNAGQPELLINDGSGQFTNVTATHLPAAHMLGAAVALGDIDGDGDADAVLGGLSLDSSGLPLLLWRNDGTGHFASAAAQLPPHAVDAVGLELVDVDGDGDRDIVGLLGHPYLSGPEGLLLFTNDGSGAFTDASANLPAALARRLSVDDIDADGDPDLVLDVATLHNGGTGNFTLVGAPANRIAAGVFGDTGGATDVLDGSFDVSIDGQLYEWGWQVPRRGWVGDLDGDGDRDLVVRCMRGSPYLYNWSIAYSGLLLNLRRDLRVSALPRLGRECRVELRAAGNGSQPTMALVAFATSRLAQPVPVAGWGNLHLDLQTAVLFGFASIPDADTAVTLPLSVPPDPVFAGLELTFQGLFGPVGNEHLAHFSAAVTHAILP